MSPSLAVRALTPILLFLASCISSEAQRGVAPTWREGELSFEQGATNRAEVLERLGPPSQILSLENGSAFYYLLETTEAKGFVLILYNKRKEKTDYDRAVFFFDKAGLLTEWALSQGAGN